MSASNTRKPRTPKVRSYRLTLQPLGPTRMGRDYLTSTGGKETGIALPANTRSRLLSWMTSKMTDFRGRDLRAISFHHVDYQSQFKRDPMQALRSATNL